MNPLIIYHGNCHDGMAAAWAVKQKLRTAGILPAVYNQPPPPVNDRDVVIVDFSYKREIMELINKYAHSLVVLDHHASAEKDCVGLDYCIFDKSRSGAGMAWDYFHPGKQRPKWLAHVEDRDLWNFNLPNTKKFHAYAASFNISLASCDMFNIMDYTDMIAEGEIILRFIRMEVQLIIEQRWCTKIDDMKVVIVNCPYEFASDACHELLEFESNCEYAMAWYQRADGKYHYSLRSRTPAIDVSKIASRRGGGGHKMSAAFVSAWTPTEIWGGHPS